MVEYLNAMLKLCSGIGETDGAIAQGEAILANLAAGDDAGALHGVRRLVAYVRHVGTSAGWLDTANQAAGDLRTAEAERRAGH